ncbi:hypothetical protein LBMAG52_22340 [Planctomycetia bacterium]|nr:hypothetical protein LBMAG52_22340 [Planctomycetia bacterium]
MSGWKTLEIAGKAADIFEPSRPSDPARVVLFLHGHGLQTLAGNAAYSAELERIGLRAICPHGKRSWWLPVVCPEFDAELSPIGHLRSNVLPWIETTWNVKPPALAAFGVSMGGQGALQLAYRHPNEFPVIAALSPVIDIQEWLGQGLPLDEMFADQEAARQQTATLQVQGLNWPRHQFLACDPTDRDALPGVEKLVSKLNSSGVPFERDFTTSHGGHSWEYFNHLAPSVMQFLANGLDAEFRRVA